MSQQKDQLFRQLTATPGSFTFDHRVASVFEDMISRSVPGYQQILQMLPTLTRQFTQSDANYYDLGCSLGAGLLAMAEGLKGSSATLIGVDNSAAMLAQADNNISHLDKFTVRLEQQNIQDCQFERAAMILMNFTLQFIPIEHRTTLLERLYQSLLPGGALVLSEKIKFDDVGTSAALTNIHHQYKFDQGYSELEISQKRDAIENVLIPETLDTHLDRLNQAGFAIATPWVQNLQFVSILAIK
ncbi:carboxy-S-adenosyl-L-methionine synthase CmoA [Arenicella xantha]|uniref:Carboxy-S-adenosyl-L-methionine synthase n=1 Tax=Arenicella xantha TaxID=644221 RepID=A0A395JQP0_9GAMM|nr:carboxy-S-adenosyl-L-methionine synthase CmoA [Arenicella xantha]RBP52642.1 tRNA (cmo5U34)-methyltransferase [Arenicella xantha]